MTSQTNETPAASARAAIPFPLALAVGACIGAGAFRLRGSSTFAAATGRGATTARLTWACAMGLVAWLAGAPVPLAGLLVPGMWLGCIGGWRRSLTLGRDPRDGAAPGQYLRHAVREVEWALVPVAFAAVTLAGLAWWRYGEPVPATVGVAVGGMWPLLAAGLACVTAYETGWRLRPDGRGAVEIGELLFGACIGAGVVLSA